MAQPGFAFHFWERVEPASSSIFNIDCRGTNYPYDVVSQAWRDIPAVYFPRRTPPNSTIHYKIQREAYRGLPPVALDGKKPDVIVIRLQNLPPPQPGQGQLAEERDVLWIECKAPNHDKPGDWKDAIKEAELRLEVAHPDRMVFLIVAVGLKWIPFVWNPELNIALATAQQQGRAQLAANLQAQIDQASPLRLVYDNRQGAWGLDPRLHMIHPTLLQGHQRHVLRGAQGEWFVDTAAAYTLDYWTLDQNTGQPAYQNDAQLLENLFTVVQNTAYNTLLIKLK